MTKTVYAYDQNGYYIGEAAAHKSPLEEDVYLMPSNSTEVTPPDFLQNKLRKWSGGRWIEEDVPDIELDPEFTEEALLEKLKQDKLNEVEQLRKNLQFQPITYQNIELSASQMARQNMLGIIEILRSSPSQETQYWQDLNKETHYLNYENFRSILSAISLRDKRLYFVEAKIRKIIQSSSDINFLEGLNTKNLWDEQEQKYNESQEEATI